MKTEKSSECSVEIC